VLRTIICITISIITTATFNSTDAMIFLMTHLQVPLPDLGVLDQELGDVQVRGQRDAQLVAAAREVAADEQLPELLVEGAQVAHEAARHRAVTCGGDK
jgi:hypothetical protein